MMQYRNQGRSNCFRKWLTSRERNVCKAELTGATESVPETGS